MGRIKAKTRIKNKTSGSRLTPCRDDNQTEMTIKTKQIKTMNKKTEDAKMSSVFFSLPTSHFTLHSLTTHTFTDTTTPA